MAGKVNEPGIHPAVDEETANHMLAQYKAEIDCIKDRGKTWSNHVDDYRRLQDMLRTLSDRVTYSSAMIPMGKKAYFEGELVHTNEIMVLLGDNWFAERSALQASEICQRRIDKCTEILGNLDKELTLVESWCKEASDIANPKSGENLEIREPYDEEAEAEWKIKHKEAVAKHKFSEKQRCDIDDESLFRRLDELELEEELDLHLEEEKLKKVIINERSDADSDDHKDGPHDDNDNEVDGKSDLLQEVEDVLKESGEDVEDWSESPDLSDDSEDETFDPDNKCNSPEGAAKVSRFSVSEVSQGGGEELKPGDLSLSDIQRREHMAKIKPRRRRVSFGSISERLFRCDSDETISDSNRCQSDKSTSQFDNHDSSSKTNDLIAKNYIYISHHPDENCYSQNDHGARSIPNDPSDLLRIYGSGSPSRLKSILKPAGSSHSLTSIDEENHPRSSFFGRFSISPTKSSVDRSLNSKAGSPNGGSNRFSISPVQPIQKAKVNPVCGTVVERDEHGQTNSDFKPEQVPKKQSRFRLSRVKQS